MYSVNAVVAHFNSVAVKLIPPSAIIFFYSFLCFFCDFVTPKKLKFYLTQIFELSFKIDLCYLNEESTKLRGYMLTCQRALRAHVPTCLARLRVHVSYVLTCSRVNVSCVLTC